MEAKRFHVMQGDRCDIENLPDTQKFIGWMGVGERMTIERVE